LIQGPRNRKQQPFGYYIANAAKKLSRKQQQKKQKLLLNAKNVRSK
jgi:hypothetical protein